MDHRLVATTIKIPPQKNRACRFTRFVETVDLKSNEFLFCVKATHKKKCVCRNNLTDRKKKQQSN